MRKLYLLAISMIPFLLWSQNQPPVAVPDTMETLSQVPSSMNVLLNDYDPDGDDIMIKNLKSPKHGHSEYEDSIVTYVSYYYYGPDSMEYRIKETNNSSNVSEYTYIFINVLENPDVPYAVPDTFSIRKLEPTELDILANDGDPNGDTLMVHGASYTSEWVELDYSPDATSIIATTKYAAPDEFHFHYSNREKGTTTEYYSNNVEVHLIVQDNPEIPTAVNDTFQVTGGITGIFDVLTNDLDPLGDTIEIYYYTEPQHGSLSLVDNIFHYTATTSYTGNDKFDYKFRYKNKPWLYTQAAEVYILVAKNPDCPVGATDYGTGLAFTDIQIEVLSNDIPLNSEEIEIKDVKTNNSGFSFISYSGDTVTYKPSLISIGNDTAYYRIRKVNAPDYYSEWIPIVVEVSQNPDWPMCKPDSAIATSGMPVHIRFLANDIIHDTIEIRSVHGIPGPRKGGAQVHGDTLTYTPFIGTSGKDSLFYNLTNYFYEPYIIGGAWVYIDIIDSKMADSLYINNINAGIRSSNMLFTRCKELPEAWIGYEGPHFEVPKGSGKHTIFNNVIWIGGLNSQGELHLAGERYRQIGRDYQPGPISNNYDSAFLVNWQRTWKVTKEEINTHISDWWKDDYEMPEAILNWPGNGDPNYGMPHKIAPYYDNDGNGLYTPHLGDYPLIRGDECIFYMFNDDRVHSETQGDSLKVEIHCMAYAYDAPEDSILNNTIFLHYDLINRSEETYYDTYFGVFTDLELGYGWDDFVGSHVMGNSFYAYNKDFDGSILNPDPEAYADKPPAQSVTFLAGPYIDADGEDNPDGNCDEGINGINFSNSIVDDERHGMSYFIYFNSSGGAQDDPQIAIDYYRYMQVRWRDNTHLMFGGWGHFASGAVGPECRFMWPGDSDPYNWGTNCGLPNDGYNQNGRWWTEKEVGSYPGDRRGMASSGPFTFKPGDVQEVDLAYVFANSYHSADSSVSLLGERLMELRQRVLDGEIVIPNSELDINEHPAVQLSFDIYPNPAGTVIHLQLPDELQNCEYFISNAMGTRVRSGILSSEINVSGLKPGFYIISIKSSNGIVSRKFIKY